VSHLYTLSFPTRINLTLAVPYDNVTGILPVTPGLVPTSILNTGHDRSYRFSFYSNALSATIHARSLSELPADGQTFEELFSGIQPSSGIPAEDASTDRKHHLDFSQPELARKPSLGTGNLGTFQQAPPPNFAEAIYPSNGINKTISNRRSFGADARTSQPPGDNDADSNTWWLDILNPTDEEMKTLSKVSYRPCGCFISACPRVTSLLLSSIQVFSIHPLTTEDILMEETREKIELFRNYYLVCFRSFDQDPYSPTHLEPLNMYIIVFREGILSVSQFLSFFISSPMLHFQLPILSSHSHNPLPLFISPYTWISLIYHSLCF
jgi:magnesium transporter